MVSAKTGVLTVTILATLGVAGISLSAAARDGVSRGERSPRQPEAPAQPAGGQIQVPTTINDFFQPGTQPGIIPDDPFGLVPFQEATQCSPCHGDYPQPNDPDFMPPGDGDGTDEPYDAWVASLMAQAARDPVWRAAVDIANQDATGAGELCIRCHAPFAWLAGRSTGGELEDLDPMLGDLDGISCHFCHRMVDPIYDVATSPPQDADVFDPILNPNLVTFTQPGQARFVIDPDDVRRGPFDDIPVNPHGSAEIIPSPFHTDSALCGACHDVSTPTYMKQPDGTYVLAPLDAPHPTQDPADMFPEQRTYSEWFYSDFNNGGVQMNGRFGGNHINNPAFIIDGTAGVMQSCQDCHMPDVFAGGCFFWEFNPAFPPREDMPKHAMNGANTWVLDAIFAADQALPEPQTGLTQELVDAAYDRTISFLQRASDTELTQNGDELNVRVINFSGHKLPTGYAEGRRMWINVQFLDDGDNIVGERGFYDFASATLHEEDTKVYHAEHIIDEPTASAVNLPVGTKFHLALNNKVEFDNRIPPIGFTNADYEAIGAGHVGYSYPDGQNWDDTGYLIPSCATQARVRVYYQTTTREYIEFLRDKNENPVPNRGTIAYDAWVAQGKSEPVAMDDVTINLARVTTGDVTGDGVTDTEDILAVVNSWGDCPPQPLTCPADLDCSGRVDTDDLLQVINDWD